MQKSVSPEATMAHDAEDCEFATRLCSPMRENDGDSARLAALTDNVAMEFWNACRLMEDGPSGGRCNPEPCLPARDIPLAATWAQALRCCSQAVPG